jgi:hypothetical protein
MMPSKVSGSEFTSIVNKEKYDDKYDGWACCNDRATIPLDYDSKQVISNDDCLNLRIELNTKSPEELEKSPVLFAQEFKTIYRECKTVHR